MPRSRARTYTPLFVAAPALLATVTGCGLLLETERLPQTQTPPTPCADLDEAACVTTARCVAVYEGQGTNAADPALCAPCTDSALPCDCGGERPEPPPPQTFITCRDAQPCENLDESACIASPDCEPIYSGFGCATGTGGAGAAYCDAEDCARPCDPAPAQFDSCQPKPEACVVACDLYCPYGYETDDRGCPTCACLPAPNACAGLDEQACIADPGCEPVYNGGSGRAAPADDCLACEGPDCDPAYPCGAPPPPEVQCVPVDTCQGLDEQACIAAPGCGPIYVTCGVYCEPGDTNCAPCEAEYYECGAHR